MKAGLVRYLNLSGQMGAATFADNFTKVTHDQTLLEWFIKNNFLETIRQYEGYDHSLQSLTTPMMNQVTGYILPRLPKGVVYLNVVGIQRGDGLPENNRDADGSLFSK